MACLLAHSVWLTFVFCHSRMYTPVKALASGEVSIDFSNALDNVRPDWRLEDIRQWMGGVTG